MYPGDGANASQLKRHADQAVPGEKQWRQANLVLVGEADSRQERVSRHVRQSSLTFCSLMILAISRKAEA